MKLFFNASRLFRRKQYLSKFLVDHPQLFSLPSDIQALTAQLEQVLRKMGNLNDFGLYLYRSDLPREVFERINKNPRFLTEIDADHIPFNMVPDKLIWLPGASVLTEPIEHIFLGKPGLCSHVTIAIRLAIPLQFRDRFLGLIVFAVPPQTNIADHSHTHFFKTLSRQLSATLYTLTLSTEIEAERQEKSKYSEKARQAKALNYFISHEVKDPLHILYGQSKYMFENPENAFETTRRSAYMMKECTLLMQFLNNYILLEKVHAGLDELELSLVDMADLLEDVMSKYRPLLDEKHLTVIPTLSRTSTIADKEKLRVVFSNILSNAIKYSFENHAIHVKLTSDNTHILISFQDSGPGASPHIMKNVFNKFVCDSLKRDDSFPSGLGLFICQTIVTKHEGEITIESVSVQGTLVTIKLPKGDLE